MTLRKIATIGNPVLRQLARTLSQSELSSPPMQTLIDDMIATMHDADGAGIAAPQVYESVQICVIEIAKNPRYPERPSIPLTVLVNPVLTPQTDETFEHAEGCLSVPNLRAIVPRFCEIRVQAWDHRGENLDFIAKGLTAGVYQHEIDHLQGQLFLDRVQNTKTITTWADFDRFHRAAFAETAKRIVQRFGQ